MDGLISLMRENAVGTFIIIMTLIGVLYLSIVAFFDRNKPIMRGGSDDLDDDACEDDWEDDDEEDDDSLPVDKKNPNG